MSSRSATHCQRCPPEVSRLTRSVARRAQAWVGGTARLRASGRLEVR
jgi:hypothetical protein